MVRKIFLDSDALLCLFSFFGCLERTRLYKDNMPSTMKMVPTSDYACYGDINELNTWPMVIDKRTVSPEQSMIINKPKNGTRICCMPYVIPTPNPSKLTAMTKMNNPV